MRPKTQETVTVHVNIDIPVDALQAIVAIAKEKAGKNEKGHYRVDTADKVGEIVTKFLLQTDFVSFASDPAHYADGPVPG